MKELVDLTISQIVESIKNMLLSFVPVIFAYEGAMIALAICVGLMVTWWGIKDNSFMIGGMYMKSLPYKGYHRFRSQKWNSEHN